MSEYKPSYMQDEEEQQSSTANPLQSQQNTLNTQAAPGSSVGQQTSAPSAAPTSTSVEGGNLGLSSGTAAAPAAPAASKRSSGQFTNLQKFISANKGADLGGRIQGNIQKQTEQAKETLTKKASEVGDVLAQQKQQRESTFGNAASALSQVGQTKEVSATEKAPTSQVAQDLAQQEQALTTAKEFQYAGPESFDVAEVEKQRQAAESQAKATGSSAGRFGLLQEMFGRTGYGAGQQKLDALLLQSDKDAQQKLAEARMSTRQFGREVEDVKQKTGEQIQTEQTAAKAEIDAFAQNLGTTSEALNQNLQDRIAAINPALEQDFANFTEQEKAEVLTKLGFNRNTKGEFAIGKLDSVGINELANIFDQVKVEANIKNLDREALARANLLQRVRGQSELAQFDETAAPFGVSEKVAEPYADIAQYAETPPSNVRGGMASAQTTGVDTGLAAQNASRLPAAKIDNMIYDTGDQLRVLQGKANTEGLDNAVAKSTQFSVLNPKEQQQILDLVKEYNRRLPKYKQAKDSSEIIAREQRDILNRMGKLAQVRAEEARTYATSQNRAQKTAIDKMAKYLRNTQGREARDVFSKDWTPTTYDRKTAYSQVGGNFDERARRYE